MEAVTRATLVTDAPHRTARKPCLSRGLERGTYARRDVVHIQGELRAQLGVGQSPPSLMPELDDDVISGPAGGETVGETDPVAGGNTTLS